MTREKVTWREACERFDDLFDGTYKTVKFGELHYSPSEVLKRVDPIAYDQEIFNFVDADGLELINFSTKEV